MRSWLQEHEGVILLERMTINVDIDLPNEKFSRSALAQIARRCRGLGHFCPLVRLAAATQIRQAA